MHTLGISCYFHDSAACLVRDGVLLGAAEEERFTRKKHDADFPASAIEYLLDMAGVSGSDVDCVAFYERPVRKLDRIIRSCVETWPFGFETWLRALPVWLGKKLWIGGATQRCLGNRPKILYCDHHLSHAASSFLVSPFDDAVVLTLDGVGEWTTTAFGYAQDASIRLDGRIRYPHSLGLFFSALTSYLGFHVNDGEWKVMGLAAYGAPTFLPEMKQLLHLHSDGSFRLNMRYFAHHYSARRIYNGRWLTLLGLPPRRPQDALTEAHFNLACSGQAMLEAAVLNITRALHKRYKIPRLCLAGGVALNGRANWKVLEDTGFEDVFVPPAAGDSGGAVGAALFADTILSGRGRRFRMEHAFWGPSFDDTQAFSILSAMDLQPTLLSDTDLIQRTVALLRNGAVVGWMQGRMEFGARALGGRSILCDARNPKAKQLINSKIKFREWFRPFAPAVAQQYAHRFFEIPTGAHLPFMTFVPRVREAYREALPGITHIDGTSRLQTVTREHNDKFYQLLLAFGEATGFPLLMNTSLNVRGEPMACSPVDAARVFLETGMDALVIGNVLVTEKPTMPDLSHEQSRSTQAEARVAPLPPQIA